MGLNHPMTASEDREAAAQQAHEAIRDRIEGYIALLRATSGLFAAVSEVVRTASTHEMPGR